MIKLLSHSICPSRMYAKVLFIKKPFIICLSGEEVPVGEQINTVDKGKTVEILMEKQAQQNNEVAVKNSKISEAERQNFEEERSKLYKQIDERVGLYPFFKYYYCS